MSVQAGIWNLDGRPVERKLLENLSESLRQQGPDGESCYVNGSVALLHRPFLCLHCRILVQLLCRAAAQICARALYLG